MSLERTLYDVVRDYQASNYEGNGAQYINVLKEKIQGELRYVKIDTRTNIVQQLIFIDVSGFDCTWANYTILEVMTSTDYSAKRIAYLAASQIWNNEDVILMATNRIQHDLTSGNSLVAQSVLSSIPSYLTESLSQHIHQDIISLMTSSNSTVKKLAIIAFYHVCLRFPMALKTGFQTLRAKLDDDDENVVITTLSILSELCAYNPSNFTVLIPRLHKFLTESVNNYVLLRVVFMLRLLCGVEPRLPKKLVNPFSNLIETSSSKTVVFEVIKTVVDVPIPNTVLLTTAAQRIHDFLQIPDPNIQFMGISAMMRMMKIQPKLVSSHKDMVNQCLESEDPEIQIMCFDLLASIANAKTVDGIVAKMYDHFKKSTSVIFRDKVLSRVIDICSDNDYALVSDFEWYIQVLLDFLSEGKITVHRLIAEQFTDIAYRVPSTREYLISCVAELFGNVEDPDLLLASYHIVGEYAEDSTHLQKVLNPSFLRMDERVQTCCISTAFKLFLRSNDEKDRAEQQLLRKLNVLTDSPYPEIQDQATLMLTLIPMLDEDSFFELKELLATIETGEEEYEDILAPEELTLPNELFLAGQKEDIIKFADEIEDEKQSEIDELIPSSRKHTKKDKKKAIQRRSQQIKEVERPMVLRKRNSQHQLSSVVEKKGKSTIISSALAAVDLSSHVSEVEEQVAQRQQLLKDIEKTNYSIKKKPEIPKAAEPGKKKKHVKKVVKQSPKKAPILNGPITSPQPQSRKQQLNEGQALLFIATDFHVDPHAPNQINIDLEIKNNSKFSIKSLGVAVDSQDSAPISKPLAANSKIVHTLQLSFDDIFVPHLVSLRFTPDTGAIDAVQTSIRIYPSIYLFAGSKEELEVAKGSCQIEKKEIYEEINPKFLLQTILNVSNGYLHVEEDKSRTVFAKNNKGDYIICHLAVEEKLPVMYLSSTNESLADSIIKEIALKLK